MTRFAAFAFLLFALLSPSQAQAWTFYFYIAGDMDYTGPTWGQDPKSSELKDQAKALYEHAQKLAQTDLINRYVIYYDPRGGVGFWWFSSDYSRLEVYSRGRLIWDKSWSETDSLDPKFHHTIFNTAEMELIVRDATHRFEDPVLLYYYGEHIPAEPTALDESHPESKMGLKQFREFIHTFWREVAIPKIILMHSCYMGTIEFIRSLPVYHNIPLQVLVPTESISNTALNLRPIQGTRLNSTDLSKALVSAQDREHYDHDLVHFHIDNEMVTWLQHLKKLEASVDVKLFNRDLVQTKKTHVLESAVHPMINLEKTDELIVSLEDYLNLLMAYTADLSSIDIFRNSTKSNWGRLKKILQPL